MDVVVSLLISFLSYNVVIAPVPPAFCFEQFKWQDCGMPPKAVLYYYKSGSRCEVGMWRGCLPNPNMFVDEYECVQTCIFSVRARDEDFHKFQAELPQPVYDYSDSTTDITTVTGVNGTDVIGTGNETVTGETAAGDESVTHGADEATPAVEDAAGDGAAEAPGGEGEAAEGGEPPVAEGEGEVAAETEAPPPER